MSRPIVTTKYFVGQLKSLYPLLKLNPRVTDGLVQNTLFIGMSDTCSTNFIYNCKGLGLIVESYRNDCRYRVSDTSRVLHVFNVASVEKFLKTRNSLPSKEAMQRRLEMNNNPAVRISDFLLRRLETIYHALQYTSEWTQKDIYTLLFQKENLNESNVTQFIKECAKHDLVKEGPGKINPGAGIRTLKTYIFDTTKIGGILFGFKLVDQIAGAPPEENTNTDQLIKEIEGMPKPVIDSDADIIPTGDPRLNITVIETEISGGRNEKDKDTQESGSQGDCKTKVFTRPIITGPGANTGEESTGKTSAQHSTGQRGSGKNDNRKNNEAADGENTHGPDFIEILSSLCRCGRTLYIEGCDKAGENQIHITVTRPAPAYQR